LRKNRTQSLISNRENIIAELKADVANKTEALPRVNPKARARMIREIQIKKELIAQLETNDIPNYKMKRPVKSHQKSGTLLHP